MTAELALRVLSGAALFTLLLAAGVRLTPAEVVNALIDWRRFLRLLTLNFGAVPVLAVTLAVVFHLPAPAAVALLLLSSAPFAPVVPVFARLARADLALAAGLTAVLPLFCTFLTPLIGHLGMKFLPDAGGLQFRGLPILEVLLATVTAPLSLGVAVNHFFPETAARLIRPAEIVSEVVGAASLMFAIAVEFSDMLAIGLPALALMVFISEASLLAGWWCGGPTRAARRVTGLGTANRNIAVALLVAADSFPGTPVVGAVVANGLLLILLGLFHVGWWRFGPGATKRTAA